MKLPKQEYTTEFKEQAVAQVTSDRGIAAIARELGLSEQMLRNWVKAVTPDHKRLTDAQLLVLDQGDSRRGQARLRTRMARELRRRGFTAGEERGRLMREHGHRARHKRRFKATTNSKHDLPVAPNQGWTADMSYLWTDESWLYLAVVLDLFNPKWSAGRSSLSKLAKVF